MDSRDMKFLGAGCSRLAYSLGDGWCLKKPIPERFEAGALQNKLEYENFKLGEEEGLTCFPRAKSCVEDWSEIVVEECKHLESSSDLLEAFNFSNELTTCITKALASIGRMPFAQFVGFNILGWLEDMTIEKACALLDPPALSRSDFERVMPFEGLDDILAFLKLLSSPSSKMSMHATMARAMLTESEFLRDILRFKFAHPSRLFARDLWNVTQYGLTQSGRLAVIDAGYNHAIAKSAHFKTGSVVNEDIKKSEDFDTFNGERCSDIRSPSGSPIEWKFFTSRGTEYVLSSELQARRIKQAGLKDDGLHPWMDRMVFVDEADAIDAMNTMASIQQTLTPVKVKSKWESGSSLDVQKLVAGQWQTQLSVVIQDTKPQIGKNVLEFMLDGDSIVKVFHAGHAVTKLKHFDI